MSITASDPNSRPALGPPPGTISNLIDPQSQGYVTILLMTVFLSLTTPIVLVRVYTRHFINRCLWWDDFAAVIAWIGLFGLAGILFETLRYGNGVDLWNVSVAHAARFTQLFADIEIVARISMFFTKLSILLLLLRVFVPPHTPRAKIYYVIWVVIFFNLLYCIALVLTVLLQCTGKTQVPGTTCIDTYSLLVTASIINVLSDLVMLIIPLVAVWNLHMPLKRKLGISLVFAVGMLAVASSVARLGWQIRKAKDPNRTVMLIKVALLAVAEQTTGIIVGCMPVLPAFFRHVIRKRSDTRSSKARSETCGAGYRTNNIAYRNSRPTKGTLNDPYLLRRKYEELDDLENGHSVSIDTRGTTTTIVGSSHEGSLPRTTSLEHVQGSQSSNALVSTTVQVSSHPLAMERNPILPQSAHLRE